MALEAAAAAGLPGIAVSTDAAGSRAWSRDDIEFAVQAGSTVEFRIGAAIAAAALRTPDTSRSDRGSDWVAFAPSELDGHALDRLGAWFGAAHRRALG